MESKLSSVEALHQAKEEFIKELHLDTTDQDSDTTIRILVCAGGGCVASGSLEVSKALKAEIEAHDLSDSVKVIETGCFGPCVKGPVACIQPDGTFYQHISVEDAKTIIEEHIIKGNMVESLIEKVPETNELVPKLQDLDFFKQQVKIALRNCGNIDPLNIKDYIALDGYQGLAKALTEMSPEEVAETVKQSGLRGRGGAGFPVGLKWSLAQKVDAKPKYVLCNADEGDPGAFMDRSVLEGDPHSLIEAMAIAGYTIGSNQGYVYVRAEYPLAVERLNIAIEQALEFGVLGKNILGTNFSFNLEVRMGSGAFVCGEETALMASIEGKRGEPRPRPPFPAVKGLWDKPSLLNNVESYANIPAIIRNGAEWYAAYGTVKSKGTKVFALAGSVNNSGLVEIPIGTPLGEIVFDIGGGIIGDKPYKAAQIGGPSGGCIPKAHLNVSVDYEALNELGAIMGSGGLIVMDEDSCMVDVARFFLEFVQEESCGKCAPCRIGTKRMLEILTDICEGRGRPGDIERLINLGEKIKDTALCGLGQSAPNPVLSTIRHFRDEYEAHIYEKRCPAGVCHKLFRTTCQNACPANVDIPGFVSLTAEERYEEAMIRHRETNPLAEICARVCFHPCENKCRRADLDSPLSIRGVKRYMVEQDCKDALPEFRENPENAKRKIAIIGAGPAGITCAYFLLRLGYKPEIFESTNKPGGMLVQAIPAYRLPRDVLDHEIGLIEKKGAKIHLNKTCGKDFTIRDLREQGYEAIFLAVGAPTGTQMGIPNEDADGVVDGLSFLKNYNLTGHAEVGRNVVIVGGGNSAIDAARTALRLGAETVTVLYRRTRHEMTAYEEEILEAEREGVIIKELVVPIEVNVRDGKAKSVRCRSMALGEYDRSGRRKPVPGGKPDFDIEADQIITAIGQKLDIEPLIHGLDVELDRWKSIKIDPNTGKSSIDWLFAGGDTVLGPSSVVEAIGHGECAAAGMDAYLTGENHAFWRDIKEVDTRFDPEADPEIKDRPVYVTLPIMDRKDSFKEVEMSWDKLVALSEAKRCLRCDFKEPVAE